MSGSVAPNYRAGVVALLGPPNAGKSTLLNSILGQKLAIVTAKPQTTRSRILGIHTRDDGQIVFHDTPGLHESAKLLNGVLNDAVEETARGADLALILVDRARGWNAAHSAVADLVRAGNTPAIVVGTKSDLVRPDSGVLWPPLEAASLLDILEVSATTGEGVEELEQRILVELPESPALYPEDEITDRSVRWLAGELVREVMFEELGQELPYAMAAEVIDYDESKPEEVTIHVNLLVARNSQKRIVIGAGGAQIKRIGIRARKQIEELVGMRVHLKLWVKIDPKWLKNKARIEELGYG
ncbi:MAG: GTPase Era [Myxococcota bacterium]|nr:GTPase Era [Myxococcota bacterium]